MIEENDQGSSCAMRKEMDVSIYMMELRVLARLNDVFVGRKRATRKKKEKKDTPTCCLRVTTRDSLASNSHSISIKCLVISSRTSIQVTASSRKSKK